MKEGEGMGNFSFLKEEWPYLAELAHLAEENLFQDPCTALKKLGLYRDFLLEYLGEQLEEGLPMGKDQDQLLSYLHEEKIITDHQRKQFDGLRKGFYGQDPTPKDACLALRIAFHLGVFLMEEYSRTDYMAVFIMPEEEIEILFEEGVVEESQEQIDRG